MLYAIVSPEDTIQRYEPVPREAGKGWRCLPVTVAGDPDADPATAPAHDSAVETASYTDAVGSDVVVRTWTVAARDVDSYRLRAAQRVKAEAQRRIYAFAPQWRQANATARAIELIRKGESNWTAAEAAEAAELDAMWERIKAEREASNLIESEVAGLSLEALAGFAVAASPHWPENI